MYRCLNSQLCTQDLHCGPNISLNGFVLSKWLPRPQTLSRNVGKKAKITYPSTKTSSNIICLPRDYTDAKKWVTTSVNSPIDEDIIKIEIISLLSDSFSGSKNVGISSRKTSSPHIMGWRHTAQVWASNFRRILYATVLSLYCLKWAANSSLTEISRNSMVGWA